MTEVIMRRNFQMKSQKIKNKSPQDYDEEK